MATWTSDLIPVWIRPDPSLNYTWSQMDPSFNQTWSQPDGNLILRLDPSLIPDLIAASTKLNPSFDPQTLSHSETAYSQPADCKNGGHVNWLISFPIFNKPRGAITTFFSTILTQHSKVQFHWLAGIYLIPSLTCCDVNQVYVWLCTRILYVHSQKNKLNWIIIVTYPSLHIEQLYSVK